MANRYHVTGRRSRAATRKGRFDLAEEENIAKWIQEITQENRFDLSLFEWLKNGQVLCKLVNKIRPKSIKLNKMVAPAKKKENIQNFLLFSQSVGCRKEDMFEPNDLLEEENLAKVVSGLYAFSSIVTKIAPQYAGPTLKLPGIFAGYYQSHFKASGQDLEHIYKRFGVAVPDKIPSTTTTTEQRKEAPRKEARFQEAPPSPLAPGNFAGYYESHFKPGKNGFEDIYKRYGVGVVPRTTTAPPSPSSTKFSPSVGSFNGAAGAFGGITVEKNLVPDEKFRILPSMGTFSGGISKFGGILVLQEAAENAPTDDVSFLPSMGTFHGAAGMYGGVLVHRR